ncbi:MAG: HAMP domain-containing histidine kinase [Fidelibacterota bacterium]|nr:MAG: HAMP domain-containing histidine kinase [Candidatus Neomarinimicrobiota bacterium]
MTDKLDQQASLEDLIQQFRLTAAEVQSAYHQLEQELLMPGEETWEPTPAATGLALPNLAPLYLIGTLVGGLSKASLVINQDLEVVSTNSDAQKDFSLGEATSLKEVLAPNSLATLQEYIDEAVSHGTVEIKKKNGSSAGIYDCIYLDNPIEKGRLLLLVAQELELDHLREVEDQILKNLTGTLVHEIRTPLTSMQGFAELLMQVQHLAPKESSKLDIIRSGIERLSLLASALGTVFHDTIEPHWIKVDLFPFLQHFLAEYISNRSLPQGLIDLVEGQKTLQVVTDPELLRLALDQVLDNAVEALAQPVAGDIQVELQHDGGEATIAIRDRGPGLAGSDSTNWWVPFFTTKSGHLGLGLVRVRRIVETLGGRAEVHQWSSSKSDTDGQGVEVDLTLPV